MGKKDFSELVNLKEVRDHLCEKAMSRRAFCHYTSIDGLKGMICSSKLHLSKGTKMNDLLEGAKIPKWERTYIASFSHTFLESIAMWCVYSKDLSETVRLQFLPSKIWQLAKNGNGTTIYRLPSKKDEKYTPIGNPEDIFLCDVSYLRKHSLSLDENILSEIKCAEIKDIMSNNTMLGFVKHSAWEYEKETRLCIILPTNKEGNYPEKIAIDFEGMNGARILEGPCVDTNHLKNALNELKNKFNKDTKKLKTINSIKFIPDNGDYISALKDKLYLPAFCEKCQRKDSCSLYKKVNS